MKVLLVDDDSITYSIIEIWLKDIAEIDYAPDAIKALEMLKRNFYPVVIFDINLKKGETGVGLLKKMRQIPGYETIPVIACTAYAMAGDEAKLLSEGFNFYISKPFEKNELIRVTNEAISKINI